MTTTEQPASPGVVQCAHPIVIHGQDRSGTTFLNALLDSHPEVAMCFEVTPNKMASPLSEIIIVSSTAVAAVGAARLSDPADVDAFAEFGEALLAIGVDGDSLQRFFIACRRSLVLPPEVVPVLERASASGLGDLTDNLPRIRLGAFVVEEKRARLGLAQAGVRLPYPPEQGIIVYPGARYLLMLRDPRDIYASHIRMEWEASPEGISRNWLARVDRLRMMRADERFEVLHVPFERLILEHKRMIGEICAFLDLAPYDMVERMRETADVFKVPDAFDAHTHIFWKQGLDPGRVGMWRELVPPDEARAIEDHCRPALEEMGYV